MLRGIKTTKGSKSREIPTAGDQLQSGVNLIRLVEGIRSCTKYKTRMLPYPTINTSSDHRKTNVRMYFDSIYSPKVLWVTPDLLQFEVILILQYNTIKSMIYTLRSEFRIIRGDY